MANMRYSQWLRVALAASSALASPALAQAVDPGAAPTLAQPTSTSEAPPAEPSQIVVTGSRITASGFSAPTPTQVLDAEAIARSAQPNIFTTISELPSLQGSTGASVGGNATSTGTQGLSSLSLRGLGPIRTLTLLDGQRVVGANVTGVADISLFPQLLVERVDVVTGGASASYGSDAVGGVVNFATKTHFEGFKANMQGGASTYGDDGNYTFQAAVGKAFLDNRLHVIASGEYSHEDGIPAYGFGQGPGPDGRTFFEGEQLINRGVVNDGQPQYLFRKNVQNYQFTKYGLITAGPLQGIAFDASGNPFNFAYGSNGVPLHNAGGNVAGCYNGFCQGGDLSGNVSNGNSLMSELTRLNGYGRIGFDVTPDNEVYATVNIARVTSSNTPNPGAAKAGNLTLQCSNPFVPAAIQAACAANGITSFQYGVSNAVLPEFINVHPTRRQYRFVGGAKGKFAALGSDWHYDAYYEHGEEITDIRVEDITLTPRYNAAIQAVRGPNGQIMCADPAAVASGCQPLNIIGDQTPSAATLAYITPANGPFQHTRQTQDVVSAAFNGSPFSTWAGPVSLAFGGEYRHEYYKVTADPYGNGVTAQSPNSADYPADPLLNPLGNNWYAGNYHDGTGKYGVYEGFVELNAPLIDNEKLGKANLNVAGRATHYSTSGTVYTWKVGGTWSTPVDGIKLRAVTSRDIRAPNLSELYAAPSTNTLTNVTDPFNNRSVSALQTTRGNPNLKPEIARNTEAGIVLSRPSWAPGLSLSFDYYRINIKGVISSLSAQQEINLCFSGVQQTCGTFDLSNPSAATVNVQSFNLASLFTDGFDIEGSYQFALSSLHLPGRLTLRALATNVRNYITDTGLPGTIPTQGAGSNLGTTPHWKLLAVESWDTDRFSLSLTERWFSAGTLTNEYIVCQSNCPVSTVNNPTIDYNRLPGALYIDLGVSHNITRQIQAYFKVDDLFNRGASNIPGSITNPQLYDVIGRRFRGGVRMNF